MGVGTKKRRAMFRTCGHDRNLFECPQRYMCSRSEVCCAGDLIELVIVYRRCLQARSLLPTCSHLQSTTAPQPHRSLSAKNDHWKGNKSPHPQLHHLANMSDDSSSGDEYDKMRSRTKKEFYKVSHLRTKTKVNTDHK